MGFKDPESTNPDYEQFKKRLYQKSGIDLNQYKSRQMMRRLMMLVQGAGLSNYCDYLDLALREPSVYARLINHITINVSEFFRNPEQFKVLQQEVLPHVGQLNPGSPLKIWCAGCSTGEEPYTVAMILESAYAKQPYRILATDIDHAVLEKCRIGRYHVRNTVNVPEHLKERYFTADGPEHVLIGQDLQKNIVFRHHNLLQDSFDSGFHLILCRNVVIYFTEETKIELYRRFYHALLPSGMLFTGNTEQIFRAMEIGFSGFRHFFYLKK